MSVDYETQAQLPGKNPLSTDNEIKISQENKNVNIQWHSPTTFPYEVSVANVVSKINSEDVRNSDNTYANTFIISMHYNDDYYYVVEAVPELKYKYELRVVSAYIGKQKGISSGQ